MNNQKDKIALYIIWGFTFIVYALVISLHYLPQANNIPVFAKNLPLLNACLNGTAFILLIMSYFFIRKKKVLLHKRCTLTACVLSIFFLLSYVLYHYLCGDASYEGDYKGVFIFILISHIILAAISLPFIIITLYRGLQGDFMKHKKIAKKIFPIWLYVTLTGVFVYVFLRDYYNCI